jgi:outer membrane protein TolC
MLHERFSTINSFCLRLKILIPLFGLMFHSLAYGMEGGPTLTLDMTLAEARAHSPRLQSALSMAREADWKKVEALSGFLPQLTVSASHFFSYQYETATINIGAGPLVFPFIYPLTTLSFDARLPIFDGFRNVFNYQSASLSQDAAHEDANWVQFQVDQDIKLKFFEALAAQKLAVVADQNLRTLEDHINKVRIRRSGGVATRYDVLRVEVQLDEAQSDKVSSDDNVVVAKQKLIEAMGSEDDSRALQGNLPTPSLSALNGLKLEGANQYLSLRGDIVSLARKVDAADKHQSAAANYWIPQISAAYDYTYYNSADATLSSPFGSAYSLGLFATWSIFDGAVSISRHKEAAEETRQAQLGLHASQLKFKTDFENWHRQYVYNAKLYEAKVADVDKAQEAVRLADEGYRAGVRTTSEVLDAELDLFRARAGAVKAQLSAAEALINLELAIGRKI